MSNAAMMAVVITAVLAAAIAVATGVAVGVLARRVGDLTADLENLAFLAEGRKVCPDRERIFALECYAGAVPGQPAQTAGRHGRPALPPPLPPRGPRPGWAGPPGTGPQPAPQAGVPTQPHARFRRRPPAGPPLGDSALLGTPGTGR